MQSRHDSKASKTAADNGRFVFSTRRFFERAQINRWYLADETECTERIIPLARLDNETARRVQKRAAKLVAAVRQNRKKSGGLDAFLHQYDLSSQEGIVLMCLAEALLRVPDDDTADRLIRDKLASGDWRGHLGGSQSLFVNASTWGLMLTGRIIGPAREAVNDPANFMERLVARVGEPVVRTAMRQAMKIMGHQFVMGRTIEEAMARSRSKSDRDYRHSYDMLGESALTRVDAATYLDAYVRAIDSIGNSQSAADESVFAAPGISVKLSALHPRYEFAQRERVMAELVPALGRLAERARDAGISFCVDAEEASRLDLSLEIFEAVYNSDACRGWEGFGLAVQTYQKRAVDVTDWVIDLARRGGRRIPMRLTKGAYWDTEIKHAQEQGLAGYPVFTRKVATDVSYLACVTRLIGAANLIYPQFATHNAHTVASIVEMAGNKIEYEFQRLHGMGEELYAEVIGDDKLNLPCRVYAPVGRHEDLLPYLVRRLLENGSNTSFVNRIIDEEAPIADLVADPVAKLDSLEVKPHTEIPLPQDIFKPGRANSRGINLFDEEALTELGTRMSAASEMQWDAPALVGGVEKKGTEHVITDPTNRERQIGVAYDADPAMVDEAIGIAVAAQPDWNALGGAGRADVLDAAADLFEQEGGELLAMCVREAGKTVPDSYGELREAIDFLRYYAQQCRADFSESARMPGPTGETNELELVGRGVFVCISPWNFPLAIFTGQVVGALAAGNAVIAKPAGQTPLVACHAVRLLHRAGVPISVLHFLPGGGSTVGAQAVADARIAGVAFTGSTDTAQRINRTLAAKDGPIATLIAETGGQNAMLVDSSALPEQVVLDVVQSSFNSAGQRCSALRVLLLQKEIAPRVLELLRGYMKELVIGDPALLKTDVGPVIDDDALSMLSAYTDKMAGEAGIAARCDLPDGFAGGAFFAPTVIEINSLAQLEKEVFGPVLHVLAYASSDLDRVIDEINAWGYGLTLGVHTRVNSTAEYIHRRVKVGNVYVNRNMIGAVVGVQPFGGCGLSGTGPKAGGPHYLHRFATERTITVNTAAVGGNTGLLSLSSS